MNHQAASIRRKSLTLSMSPSLPRCTNSPQTGKRTSHPFIEPSEEIKRYKRRAFFENLPTIKQFSSAHNLIDAKLKDRAAQNRSQLSMYKNNGSLDTIGSEFDRGEKSMIYGIGSVKNMMFGKQDNQNAQNPQTDKADRNQHQAKQQNQKQSQFSSNDENESQPEQQKEVTPHLPKVKKFSITRNSQNRQSYSQEQQLAFQRMEGKYHSARLSEMRSIVENDEILEILNKMRMRKAKFRKQVSRKLESMKSLQNLKKTASLAQLSQESYKMQRGTTSSNDLINKCSDEPQYSENLKINKRLKASMSLGKLQNISKPKKMCLRDEMIGEKQLEVIYETQNILRNKGINLSSKNLRNGLMNVRSFEVEISNTSIFPIAYASLQSNSDKKGKQKVNRNAGKS